MRHRFWWQIGGVLLSGVLAALALLSAKRAFGWFAENRNVTAGGMVIQAAESGTLEIRASVNGEDISVSAPEDIQQTLTSSIRELHPDVSGRFTFYVHSSKAPYRFHCGVSVQNNAFYQKDVFPGGFYDGATEEEKTQALQYINSHLLFFTQKDSDGYSGWIRPGETVSRDVADGASPYGMTVWWVWIGDHRNIFDEGSGVIEENTRQEIANYYDSNLDQMFVGGVKTAEAYNGADTLIGITLKYICFQVTVSGD